MLQLRLNHSNFLSLIDINRILSVEFTFFVRINDLTKLNPAMDTEAFSYICRMWRGRFVGFQT